MNWVFIDLIRWDFDVATPLERPLGGSQSAMCYLAVALARRGHRVTTLTGTTNPREISGVQCLRVSSFPAEIFAPEDTLTVVINGPPEITTTLRKVVPEKRPLIMWTGHSHDQPVMRGLRDRGCVEQWNRIVCVSEWHRRMFHQVLGVPLDRIDVQRNALAPTFEDMFPDAAHLSEKKSIEPRLVYTSTPFRGLDVLLACFPEIRRLHPLATLDVFSSMQVYGMSGTDDQYQTLYEQCRATRGVNYRGSISQDELAKDLASATMLAYPNTFAETGCIAAMEALAAGMFVVSSDLGALPETCAGWARLIEPVGQGRSIEQFAADFIRAVDETLQEKVADPASFYRRRFEQQRAFNDSCTWDVRAAEWEQAAPRWLKAS